MAAIVVVPEDVRKFAALERDRAAALTLADHPNDVGMRHAVEAGRLAGILHALEMGIVVLDEEA
jgi:hypothetical protein